MTQTQADQTDVRSTHHRVSMDHEQAYTNDTGTVGRTGPTDNGNNTQPTADSSSETRDND